MDSSIRLKLANEEDMGATKDWRKALRAQPAYRIVNKTIRGQTLFVYIVGLTGLFSLVFIYANSSTKTSREIVKVNGYNSTYPITRPIITRHMHTFRIGIIADLDTNSLSKHEKHTWFSYFKTGYLTYTPDKPSIAVTWDLSDAQIIKSNYALKGRGMELSELVTFDGKLLTFDDRTGIIFEITGNTALPWLLLMDGDGKNQKGFKSEWATVKNEELYVGSMGKEWTTASGTFENYNPMFIKKVSPRGQVSHVDWVDQYKSIRKSIGIDWPGYMIHESGIWSNFHQKWFFLPRRCSNQPYNESLDEHRGCSVLISADSSLSNPKIVKISNFKTTRGFSSFKFVPTSDDYVIVALRTEELEGKTSTYITAFTIDGDVILDDLHIANVKYEGFEFI